MFLTWNTQRLELEVRTAGMSDGLGRGRHEPVHPALSLYAGGWEREGRGWEGISSRQINED
jgi:hypothetical protein